jgi:hypothetical protein
VRGLGLVVPCEQPDAYKSESRRERDDSLLHTSCR